MLQLPKIHKPLLKICETCPSNNCEACPLSLAYNLGKNSTFLKEDMDNLINRIEDSKYKINDALEIIHDVTSRI